MTEAVDRMVVDHATGLHECVADGGAHKSEATLFEILAHSSRRLRLDRHLTERGPAVNDRFAVDELPDVGVEAAEFVLGAQKGLRVLGESRAP